VEILSSDPWISDFQATSNPAFDDSASDVSGVMSNAGDAADAAVRAAFGPATDVALNVVSACPVTWSGIVDTLFECLGVRPRVQWQPRTTTWAPRRRFDGSRATAVLGFEPTTELRAGLGRLVDWHLGVAG
jgi:nucleoside-diphosphate-sugar epimerase